MPTTTTKKKPATKLKAGKKKPLNKWLVLAGVAAVAVIGVIIVRFSSASQWSSVRYNDKDLAIQGRLTFSYSSQKLLAGKTYRFCMRGYSIGAASDVQLYFASGNTKIAPSTKRYGSRSELHCSGEYKPSKNITVSANVAGANESTRVQMTANSVDVLK